MELWERDAELASIEAALGVAAGGEGSMLVLEGPAGIGKTRILQAAQALATERGMRVLAARAGELESDFPHGVVRQLVERPLLSATAEERALILGGPAAPAARALGLSDDGVMPPSADEGFAVIHGLYWLIANFADGGPVLVVVDDAQWADPSSLRFLVYLARRLSDLPVLLLVAARSAEAGERTPLVVQLLDEPEAQRLAPQPLSRDATAELLRDRLGAEPHPAFTRTALSVTQGNPFLLRQLAEAVQHDGLAPTAGAARGLEQLGPRTVARAILLRLGRLAPEALALSRAVAVLGAEAPLRDAAALAQLDSGQAARCADALRAADVFGPDHDRLAFVHPIVRSAIYADLPETERAGWHARAAEVLRERGAEAAALGPHLLATLPAGDAVVAAGLAEAGRQARREGATATAVRLLRRALAEPPAPEHRAAILADLGAAEFAVGEEGAVEHLSAAVEQASDPCERARWSVPLARALSASQGPQAATDAIVPAIEAVEDIDRDLALRLEAELAVLAGWRDAYAPELFERLERHADLEGRTAAECLILANRAVAATQTGSPATVCTDLARRAVRNGILLDEEGPESLPLHYALVVLVLCDDVQTATSALTDTFRRARAAGSAFGFGASSLVSAFLGYRMGDMRVAESESLAAYEIIGDHIAYGPLIAGNLVLTAVERGGLADAEQLLADRGLLDAPPLELPAMRILLARGMLRLAQNQPEMVLADMREVERRQEALGLHDYELGWRTLAAQAHKRLGDTARAQQLAAEHLEDCRRFGAPTPLGRALRVAGMMTDGDDAVGLLEEAVAVLETAPGRLEHADALVQLGAALRRDGRRSAARDPLREGHDLAQRCGAIALARFAHEELTAAGAKPRRLQFSGVDALTASERRVAELAAAGLGNREIAQELFVTVKTVENHLSRVYNKLSIKSRGQLAGSLGVQAA